MIGRMYDILYLNRSREVHDLRLGEVYTNAIGLFRDGEEAGVNRASA